MQAVGYWEAWSLWLSGAKLEDFAMWGVPMLWWARIGKLLQYSGGIVVVLDLIGPKRLRKAGSRLHSWRNRLQQVEPADPFLTHHPEGGGSFRLWTLVPSGAASACLVYWLTKRRDPSFDHWIADIYRGLFLWVFSTLFVLVLGLWVFLLVVHLLLLVIRLLLLGLAKVLREDRAGHPVRWVAFVLVTAGFHFDLLGS